MSSGKWYWEGTLNAIGGAAYIGAGTAAASLTVNIGASNTWGYVNSGNKQSGNTAEVSYGSSYTTGDVIGVAFDADNGTLTFYKNGVSQGQAYSGLTSGPYFFMVTGYNGTIWAANFGQKPFKFPPPEGFQPLTLANTPRPSIVRPDQYVGIVTYTGNGSTQTISGLGFSPDLVWVKARSTADDHMLTDTVRGATKAIRSNSTIEETTNSQFLNAFTSDGFSVGSNGNFNRNTETFVAWCWDAGSSTVSNTDGSITSSVRANPTAGFSVVTWTVGTAPYTVGHGLNAEPYFIITKSRTGSGTNWSTYHKSTGNQSRTYLNLTLAASSGESIWNNTTPTSSVFSLGSSGEFSGDMVAYCFAPVEGYSAFGSHTGNGSTDGPFVYTGFRPSFLITKETSGTGDWALWDAAREPYNVMDANLKPNSSEAENINSAHNLDMLSDGFKLRTTNLARNESGATYLYIAFAEAPSINLYGAQANAR